MSVLLGHSEDGRIDIDDVIGHATWGEVWVSLASWFRGSAWREPVAVVLLAFVLACCWWGLPVVWRALAAGVGRVMG